MKDPIQTGEPPVAEDGRSLEGAPSRIGRGLDYKPVYQEQSDPAGRDGTPRHWMQSRRRLRGASEPDVTGPTDFLNRVRKFDSCRGHRRRHADPDSRIPHCESVALLGRLASRAAASLAPWLSSV